MTRALGFVCALAALLAAARAGAGDVAGTSPADAPENEPVAATSAEDPRVAEADQLLADAASFARAVELYRAALAEQPDAPEVRLRLARVLAWSQRYDESLAEFDRLLAAPAPLPGLRVERAEVLSWAGRLEPAQTEFRALLDADPNDARAVRGLARSYSWSGQLADADRSYERALALAPDPEAMAEWGALRAGFPPTAASSFEWYDDNAHYQRMGSSLEGGYYWDPDTHLRTQLTYTQVDHPDSAGEFPGLADHDRGWGGTLGMRRRLSERLAGELDLGVRVWEHAGAFPLARAALSYTTASALVLGGFVDTGDFLLRSDSVAAVEDGIQDTTTGLSAWRAFGQQFEGFAELQNSFLSDSNTRHAAGATLSWRPWPERALQVHAGASWLGYTRGTDLYYDPSSDFEATLAITHTLALYDRLELKLRGAFGWGITQQDGASANGPGYQVGADLAWRIGRFRVSLVAGRSQTQRASSYVAHRAGATLGMDF